MGKVLSTVSQKIFRPVKNFNVEVRAEKVISRDKPIPAPWHPSTKERIQELVDENPDLFRGIEIKDNPHSDRLKNLYVTSQDPHVSSQQNPNRPLPLDRQNVYTSEFGYFEPKKITPGKLSLRQAMLLLGKHQQNPNLNSPSALSLEFSMHLKETEKILRYFKPFECYIPPNSKQITFKVNDYISLKSPTEAQEKPSILLKEK